MPGTRTERLDSSRDPYPVYFGRGSLDRIGDLLRRQWGNRRVAVITHRKLERLFGGRLRSTLERSGLDAVLLPIPDGERAKNLTTVQRLYDRLTRHRLGREDGVVAFGGGVVGDTAGFAAATYLRGVPYIQVPTTLLAQIDSAIGAKVGVNHPRGKNLIGAIYRPSAVIIDPGLLSSLPTRELRSGLFEMLKYGFIGSRSLFLDMERHPDAFRPSSPLLEKAIATSVKAKLSVVRRDEREAGLRRILNFGHTVGHGLEAAARFASLTHGEAVGWGMIAACRLARRNGFLDESLAARMESAVIRLAPLPKLTRLRRTHVLASIEHDKKTGARGLRFVMPIGIGRVEIVEGITREDLQWVLAELGVGAN